MTTVQEIARKKGISYDQYIGMMRVNGVVENTAKKVWLGDTNVLKSTLDAAAKVLSVPVKELLS